MKDQQIHYKGLEIIFTNGRYKIKGTPPYNGYLCPLGNFINF